MQVCAPGMGACSIGICQFPSCIPPKQAPGIVGHANDRCITEVHATLEYPDKFATLSNIKLLQGLVTYMFRVEAFVTAIKTESSNQSPF